MFSHDKPQFRPQHSVVDSISRWMTPTNFAWVLMVVLLVVIGVIVSKGARKIGHSGYRYTLVAMNGVTLDITLRDMEHQYALVTLFDKSCGDLCAKQLDTLVNLYPLDEKKHLRLMLLAQDSTPEETMAYLESINLPTHITVYYTAPQEQPGVQRTLQRISGNPEIGHRYPHSFLIGQQRRFILEYRGYVRSQEVQRTIRMQNLDMPR